MKKNFKSIISIVLIMAMTLTMVFTFAGCSSGVNGNDGITPQLRINAETNYWEVSYDEGETWDSMGVKATGEDGKDGLNGKDGVDGKDGLNGKDGADGKDGVDGAPGKDGVDGAPGKDGVDGAPGKDGIDGEDGKDAESSTSGNGLTLAGIMNFVKFLKAYGINDLSFSLTELENLVDEYAAFIEFSKTYGKVDSNFTGDEMEFYVGEYKTYKTVSPLMANASFGRCNYQGTTNCFGSVYYRVLVDDHKYYNNATAIASYLNGVFVEKNGVVSINPSSMLYRASYCDSLTVINFALAFNGYEEYALRNNKALPSAIAQQKELAIKYFNTVDYTAAGYHDIQESKSAPGHVFSAQSVADVALGSLLGQAGTERYNTLIKAAYDNLDEDFWQNNVNYTVPFKQLCADYDWFDKTSLPTVATLTNANILEYYAWGINVAKDYPELWAAWVTSALSDNSISAAESKAFAYHYAYQMTQGDVDLGVYGSSRAIVAFK